MPVATTIMWFRQDLRLGDNPALCWAAEAGNVLPVFIWDEAQPDPALGGAGRWWLHHSLKALGQDLGGLLILNGNPEKLLPELVKEVAATSVVWNRCYDALSVARDTRLKARLKEDAVEAHSFNGLLLAEPWELETKTGGPFKVFTPFWRALQARGISSALPRPQEIRLAPSEHLQGDVSLENLSLLPTRPDWAAGWGNLWQPGEEGARAALGAFLDRGLAGYGELRNRPDLPNVSRLSPHLHFGEISPRQAFQASQFSADQEPALAGDADKFRAEIAWRDFSYHLLFHFPELAERNWKPAFDAYPWRESPQDLRAWQKGMTGYPLVDAGMRELWQTGYMHNRVRMIVASFLVKHLRLHWRHGEAWFRDTLLDADRASNAASWQWVAGSGADAAPYFRIFNPIGQGQKFDPDGAYVRQWCPELSALETSVIHAPFEASEAQLQKAGLFLGKTYPHPIVDHATARKEALAGYEVVKAAGQVQASAS